MNYIDILIVLIVAVFTALGYRRGILKTVFGLASVFIAIIIASMLMTPFTNYMETTPLSGIVKNKVYDVMLEKNEPQQGEDISSETTQTGEADDKAVDEITYSLGLPAVLETKIIDMGMEFINEAKISAKQAVAEAAAQIAFNAVCALLLYLGLIILINIIKVIVLAIAKLPIIKGLNKLAGGALGAANGILVIYVLLGVVMFMVSMGNLSVISEDIAQSSIGSVMYDNNILFKFISK